MMTDLYTIIDNFKIFIGGRAGVLHWLLFGMALAVCIFLGKKQRKLLVYPTVLVFVFFCNPLFYHYIGNKFLSGVYWRLLWMVPVTFLTAYGLTVLIYRFKKQAVRVLAAVLAVVCIAVTGRCMYNETTFTEAENLYKLPQAAIEVSDVMAAAGIDWKVRVVVPNELLCYVRQYRCDIGLLYGRNAGGFISEISNEAKAVYDEMSKETPDMEVLTNLCRQQEVIFLCFNTGTQQIPEDLSSYGYLPYRTVGDYSIYIWEEKA